MATEIIVNDGGAPSRIIPYTAYETLSAGEYVTLNASGKAIQQHVSGSKGLGFCLTAATSGNIASVVTGHGVQCNVYVSGTVAAGNPLYVQRTADDGLRAGYTSASKQTGTTVAIALEANSGGPNLKLVQVI
jgi:hypothetical protein